MLPGDTTGPPTGPVRFRVVSRTTLVGPEDRQRLGLDHWPDGTVGRIRRDGRIVTVAPNGDGLARTELVLPRWRDRVAGRRLSVRLRPHGSPSQPAPGAARGTATAGPEGPVVPGLGVLTATKDRVGGLREPADYAAGGPVLYDPGRDLALLVYHAEEYRSGEPRHFYSSLGLAVSRDGAASWTDLGRIVRAELPAEAAARSWGPVEMGPGTLVATDDRLVLLFGDFRDDGRRVNLAAAAAPRAAVLDAAAQGESVAWHKWDGVAFSQPGLGGRAAELMGPATTFGQVKWTDAVHLGRRRTWALVATTNFMGSWTLVLTTSVDGVRWSRPTVVEGSQSDVEALYVSTHGPLTRAEAKEFGPDGFAVLRVCSASGDHARWGDAVLERLVLRPTA